MPPHSAKRRAPVHDDDDVSTPTRGRRAPEPYSDEDGSGDENSHDTNNLGLMTKALVRYALACEHARVPVKRQDVNQKILGAQARQFKHVFTGANSILLDTFGMELVELPNKEKTTIRQKRAAVASESQSKTSNQWVLRNALPPQFRIPDILAAPHIPTPEDEAAYTGFYTMVIALITLSGGTLSEGRLDRFLKRMNAHEATPLGRTEEVLKRMAKEGYIVKVKDNVSGEEMVDYHVGPRGKVEVDDEAVAGLIRTVYEASEEQDLEQRIARSLNVAGGEEASNRQREAAGPSTTQAEARRRPRRRREDEDEDDDDRGQVESALLHLFCSAPAPKDLLSHRHAHPRLLHDPLTLPSHTPRASPRRSPTMSSINSLLNHDSAREDPDRRPSRPSVSHDLHGELSPHSYIPPTTFDAANALTALKTLPPISSRELPSPTFSAAPQRTSSFGSVHGPIEPSPPLDNPPVRSPSLDQYHYGSRSPEQQRRQSLLAAMSPRTVLAPIQSLTGALHQQTHPTTQQPLLAYGTDISQTVSNGGSRRDSTQNREPAFVRDEPTTSQIREAESVESFRPISTNLPQTEPAQELPAIKQEPPALIKQESTAASPPSELSTVDVRSSAPQHRDTSPHNQVDAQNSTAVPSQDGVDSDTLKAIEAVKQNDLGLRTKKAAGATETLASPVDTKSASGPSKKRPAASSAVVKKKGTAALKKSSSKKRKLDAEPESKARSATPTSRSVKAKTGRKGSQAGTPVAGSSPPPDNSSQIHPSDDDGDSSDDNTLYCICRKPDNHRWMIACDGGCEDWFHGSCVNMVQADEELVDKFICPNCQAAGRGQTTWKPMCRREPCRKPARLTKGAESKYCSDECGVLFMQQQLQRTAGAKGSPKRKKRGSKDVGVQSRVSDDEEEPIPLGGVIRASDLKALTMAAKDFDAFKRLGSGVLSPPRTASPTKPSFDGLANGTSKDDLMFTPSEREHLRALHIEQDQLQTKLEVLKDREKFVSMARERAARYADKEKIKVKDFCGYDSRLSWSDPEFLSWRRSKFGHAAFEHGTLTPTPEQIDSVDTDGDIAMSTDEPGPSQQKEKDNMCTKKRCQKHPQWQKVQLQDARFEELEVVEAIKECEKQERAVREKAQRRAQKDDMEAELMGGAKTGPANSNGIAAAAS
ncbi:MAGE-domain-containing protein [Sporormia fimetaria CBS 119925]|uniref:MAGE-domain-containing protein n=1 Tax=Sporormia fimetaria CBS 119925 TaxID=1340428 RepID=A0A6A6VAT6_9PLEO|nr:MAGE-domain-containing protein [Sporormia fimetaria CBS 119925]